MVHISLLVYVHRFYMVIIVMTTSLKTIVMDLSTPCSPIILKHCSISMTWNSVIHLDHQQRFIKLVSIFTCIYTYISLILKYYVVYKCLGLFYYQLGNLAPQYRSSLSSIQMVAIAKSSVIVYA